MAILQQYFSVFNRIKAYLQTNVKVHENKLFCKLPTALYFPTLSGVLNKACTELTGIVFLIPSPWL